MILQSRPQSLTLVIFLRRVWHELFSGSEDDRQVGYFEGQHRLQNCLPAEKKKDRFMVAFYSTRNLLLVLLSSLV